MTRTRIRHLVALGLAMLSLAQYVRTKAVSNCELSRRITNGARLIGHLILMGSKFPISPRLNWT